MSYKEKKRARIIFKRLKAGITKPEELTAEELKLLRRYYPFLFH
jgi:uncharacterized coiled-coil DUF342 family protein